MMPSSTVVFYDPRGRRARATTAVGLFGGLIILVVAGGVLFAVLAPPFLPGLTGEPLREPVLHSTAHIPLPGDLGPSFSTLRSRALPPSSLRVRRLAFLADYDERSLASLRELRGGA